VRPAGRAKVYNLTVASAHEFVANGIVTLNCRYGAMSRPHPRERAFVKPRRLFEEDFAPPTPPKVGDSLVLGV
jgi:hypothetical protein